MDALIFFYLVIFVVTLVFSIINVMCSIEYWSSYRDKESAEAVIKSLRLCALSFIWPVWALFALRWLVLNLSKDIVGG